MGVDLSCIVKNDFRDRKHKRACEDYINATIEKLSEQYCVEKDVFRMEYDESEGYYLYSIVTDMWDIMSIQLCEGMWHIECGVHYCQLFFKDQYWRLMMQEIANALGQKDLWLCDEFCAWNSALLPHDIDETSFEEWYSCIANGIEGCKNGVIPDYPTASVLSTPEDEFYDSLEAYHDTTAIYLSRLKEQKDSLDGFKPLGMAGVGAFFIPVEKDGKLYLANTDTKSLLTKSPIDSYEEVLNHAGFVIVKNGKRILYDMFGNKMSEPTKGEFNWEWETSTIGNDWPPAIIISNDNLNKRWRTDGKTGMMTEISTNK